uniref:Peroxisomal membrane protein PEX16 n=1 Tax=Skeletonema marinoi TaxID=267567 RepID=A0A6U3Z7I2_9STRA
MTTPLSSSPPDSDDAGCSSPSPLTSSLDYDASAPPLNGGSIDNTTYYEDPFLLPSNETSPTSLASSSLLSLSQTITQHQNSPQQQQLLETPSLLNRYKIFLQNHSSLLSLIEMIMERFIFYGHLFKTTHHYNDDEERGILQMEMYYATWNIIRWINDVVLLGVGGGMGLTVGTREEWLLLQESCLSNNNNNNNNSNNKLSLNQWISTRLDTIIPIIRATLTATTCIYPAVEAFSRRTNTTTNHHHRDDWDGRRHKAAIVTYRLERVRFMGRMCLLVISWWARLQRKRQQQQQQQQQSQKKESDATIIPLLLQRGGELDPYEQVVPLKHAEDEARVVQYVGRRTGRRSISTIKSPPPSSSSSRQQGLTAALSNVPFITKANNLMEWISKLLTSSSGNKLVYVYAVGEILHILRPLYWSRAECGEWQQRRRRLLPQQQQQQQRGGMYNSWSIWKAWWVSLLMDLISDKLLRLTNNSGGGDAAVMNNHRQGSSVRRGSEQSAQQHQHYQSYSSSSPSSAEEANLAELEWRRSRHGLYLLRSPMYDVVTRPVASFIARVVSMVPSMGLGRWAAEYVLDMMSYWNDNHFMLET